VIEVPETRYAKSGDVNIAYQVVGDGPFDLVHVPPFVSNLELQWEDPAERRYFERLASFSRLIMFDKRGTGLSDRVAVATLEERMDDLRAVMDAAGSERAAIYGGSEGGALSILFAATYPERVSALVLYGAYARLAWASDYSDGVPEDAWIDGLPLVEKSWGRGTGEGPFVNALAPKLANDPVFQKTYGRWERLSASPGAVVAILRMVHDLDVRHLLTAIRVPTLVVHRTADPSHAAGSRYLGAHIPGARVVELPGDQYFPHLGDQDRILDEIEEFLTGVRPVHALDRALATVLFTDSCPRRSAPPRSATMRGRGSWTATTLWSPARSSVIVVAKSTRQVTVCSRPSTALRVPCDARKRSVGQCGRWASKCGRDFTPVRSNFAVPTSVGSPSTLANASQRSPDRARFLCLRRSRT
jgi:pimeloyl-ACP methyl ester carboxylesterase